MSRVVMYVYNDLTMDSRVIREARTLVGAGHAVTVMARARRVVGGPGEREVRDGFDVVRVAVPGGWRLWWTLARHPWRLRAELGAGIRRGIRTLPAGTPDVLRGVALLLVAGAWSIVCLPATLLARRLVPGKRRDIGPLDWLVRWRFAVGGWARDAAALAPVADVHHGHDLTGLAAAVVAHRRDPGSALVYDSHEIFLEARTSAEQPGWARRLVGRLERRWIAAAVAVVTVNDSIAAELDRRYRPRRIVVVRNCPERWSRPDSLPDRLRDALGLGPGTRIAIQHGTFARHRGFEELAAAVRQPGLEMVHAVFLGDGPRRMALERIADDAASQGRVHVLPAVPPDELPGWLASADVEVIPLQRSTVNHWLASPNKLFESIAAGVPVVASDFPEMHKVIVDDPDGPLGAVCDPTDPGSIARAMRSILDLTPEAVADLRVRCLRAAHARLNWEHESAGLLGLYGDLQMGPAATPSQGVASA